jgi:antitoxin (DNA-binding transcriptional repressor) of toxin-antitoxin stability system
VTLTVHGEPVADIVPHRHRVRWLPGAGFREQLPNRASDPGLQQELDVVIGSTLDKL